MVPALFLISLFGPLLATDTFTCTGVNWTLDGSNCYKTIPGSTEDGQVSCSNQDPTATLMLAPTHTIANHVSSLFSSEKIWIGLRFCNGSEWIWDDGSSGSATWGSTPILPQLCIGVKFDGTMHDYYCYNTHGLICQKEMNVTDPINLQNTGHQCGPGWLIDGTQCYKKLRHSDFGVNFSDARTLCRNENADVMMPQSQSEANLIVNRFDCGPYCWVGITDFDADHIYTWEDGTEESQENLYFRVSEPTHRDLDYICAYIQDGLLYNGDCTATERVICEKDGTPNVPSTIEIESTTNMLETSMMYSGETSHQQDTSTKQKTPTNGASTLEKQNCTSKSRSNACQCQRRMSNTTESVKITDYIWLRKCEVQPLIDSGVLNEIDCPYTCSCSPKDNPDTNSAGYDMFACFRRP